MLFSLFLLAIGLIVLVSGGELLVRGASSIALRMRLSPLVVGLTIVAFGTSAPELFISVQSALQGSPDLAMGNVVGSNICNLALVLGCTAVIFPVAVHKDSLKIDWPMTIGSSLLLFLLVQDNLISFLEGAVFVLALAAYTSFIVIRSRRDPRLGEAMLEDADLTEKPSKNIWLDLLFIIIGTLALAFGSEWFVDGAKALALSFGVSERVIGVTVLALGTSLPELVTACVAAFRKATDIAIGNLMGSNIFNILSILGITSIIQPIMVNELIIWEDMIWMLGVTLIVFPMMFIQRKISRIEGFVLLGIYSFYIFTVVQA
ncbi:calcium/sodium antiporter [Catalinimonas niigatensis]|uniref:calcium/sodium antiporter n=1 Tax=Catalinimonas niigatensis TaxID=1397264 RepID=UPI002665AE8B|nr:calcium/sodium antiporter [Catalinimonas niigatensis]WPP49535.1 calcium/sodium antiporter [Catalinimonas niigatensis]